MFTSKQTCLNKQCSEKYIYIYSKFALLKREMENWQPLLEFKQPLQEKLDIDSEESDLHSLNIICDTDKDQDDFCVDFIDEEENWRDVFLLLQTFLW